MRSLKLHQLRALSMVVGASDHLLLVDGHVRVGRGPAENMVRPAIDALFRSAALYYGQRVIGVVLSGLLSDGAAGLDAIKRCGGLALVQDPVDAAADDKRRDRWCDWHGANVPHSAGCR